MTDGAEDRTPEAKLTSPRFSFIDSKTIRHSYDNAVTAIARLYAFCHGKNPPQRTSIFDLQSELCITDLLVFAIHFRRLCDKTISLAAASKYIIEIVSSPEKGQIGITRVVNFIIHHDEIFLIRTKEQLKFRMEFRPDKDIGEQAHLFMMGDETQIDAICGVRNEKGDHMIFQLKSLVDPLTTLIIPDIEEFCDERGLYLDSSVE